MANIHFDSSQRKRRLRAATGSLHSKPHPARCSAHFTQCLLALSLLALTGCQSACYYAQAAHGQWAILARRQPIESLLDAPETSPDLRDQLKLVQGLRKFAETELHLSVGNSYATYVQLDRPHVVWNVFATPEFSLTPNTWCYPFVGCASYRGYFAESDAEHFGKRLHNQGYDVYIGGIDAYSTLGWFDDPVPSSIAHYPPTLLAATIFHELAHKRLYVKGDTAFNESFATTVEQIALDRWLGQSGSSAQIERVHRDQQRKKEFVDLIARTRDRLEKLYQHEFPEDQTRERKRALFDTLRSEYHNLRTRWGDNGAYDRWFDPPLNNAKLSTVATYYNYVPALRNLFEEHPGDLTIFYEACEKLAAKSVSERAQALAALAEAG